MGRLLHPEKITKEGQAGVEIRRQQLHMREMRHVVDGFEEFKDLYGLTDDPALVEPGWADLLASILRYPGVASILLTNLLLFAPTTFVLRRWDPPVGTFVLLFTGVAVLMTGLDGFRNVELVLAPLAAGVSVEVLSPGGSARYKTSLMLADAPDHFEFSINGRVED